MGWDSERRAIESRFQANWTTTPIKFEGVPFAEPRVPYVALFIRNGDRSQITLGQDPTVRSVSLIIVQIFVQKDTGSALAKSYADSIAAIFDRVQFVTSDSQLISCQTGSIEYVGQFGGWEQYNVTVPYTRDEN